MAKAKMPTMAKLEKVLGVKFDPDAMKKMMGNLPKDSKLGATMKMEATISSLLHPEKSRISKVCKNPECGDAFMTLYHSVAYCSDQCRREVLAAQFGIEAVEKNYIEKMQNDNLWGGTEYPQIIDMKFLSVMKYLVETVEAQTGQTVVAWSAPETVHAPAAPKSESHPVPDLTEIDLDDIDRLLEGI